MMTFARVVCLAVVLPLVLGCSKAEEDKSKEKRAAVVPPAASAPAAPAAASAPAAPVAASTPAAPAAASTPAAPVAASTPAAPPAAPPAVAAPRVPQSGTVTEVQQAGTYTYVEVEADGKRWWLATNQTEVKTGELVHWFQSSLMANFHSKILNRTFPALLFVGAVLPGPFPENGQPPAAAAGRPAMPAGHPGMPAAGHPGMSAPQSGIAAGGGTAAPPQETPVGKGKVHVLMQSGGYTYVQVNDDNGPWLAAPTVAVKEGDTVSWGKGMVMKDFTSKSLNRVFPEIVFLGSLRVE
ncbi:MAG: hypothetical protein HQM03_14785 [Magnetococcales bacterium]|nr:hypothetical protein [Magnetococcales bacterium]